MKLSCAWCAFIRLKFRWNLVLVWGSSKKDRERGMAEQVTMYCHQKIVVIFIIWDSYTCKLYIKMAAMLQKLDWNHHHRYLSFYNFKKLMKMMWKGCVILSFTSLGLYCFCQEKSANSPKYCHWQWTYTVNKYKAITGIL